MELSTKSEIYQLGQKLGLTTEDIDDFINCNKPKTKTIANPPSSTINDNSEKRTTVSSAAVYKAGTKYGTFSSADVYKAGTWYGTVSISDIYKAGTMYGSVSPKDFQ